MIYSRVTSVVLPLLLAVQTAFAQPHGRRHNRRDNGVAYETSVVYVDQYGNTLDPAVYGQQAASSTTPTAAISTTQSATSTSTPTASPSSTVAASSLGTSGSTNNAVASSGQGTSGIAYNPYDNSGNCKSIDDISADIAKLSAFGVIRIYDLSCHQVQNVINIAKTRGIKVYIGIPNESVSNCDAAIAQIVTEVGNNWSSVYAISVGNELVAGGVMAANDVVALVDKARTALRAAGYTGPVVTTDAWITIVNNKVLCQHSDFVAANCHPFFDSNVAAPDSGKFVSDSIAKLQGACGSKEVIITETGWPHQGNPFNAAVPGLTQQQDAVTSIHSAVSSFVIYFLSFDALWKTNNAGTYGTEQYWGIQNLALVS